MTAELKLPKDSRDNQKIFLAEIDWAALMAHRRAALRYAPLPEHPAVQRDLALVADEAAACGDIIAEMRRACPRLGEVELFDIYRSEAIGAGKKSMAFTLHFVPEKDPLTTEEVDRYVKKILGNLKYRLAWRSVNHPHSRAAENLAPASISRKIYAAASACGRIFLCAGYNNAAFAAPPPRHKRRRMAATASRAAVGADSISARLPRCKALQTGRGPWSTGKLQSYGIANPCRGRCLHRPATPPRHKRRRLAAPIPHRCGADSISARFAP